MPVNPFHCEVLQHCSNLNVVDEGNLDVNTKSTFGIHPKKIYYIFFIVMDNRRKLFEI